MCEGVQGTLFIAVLGLLAMSTDRTRGGAGGASCNRTGNGANARAVLCALFIERGKDNPLKEGRSQGRPSVAFELRSKVRYRCS